MDSNFRSDELVKEVEKKMGKPIFTQQGREDSQWITAHAQQLIEQYPDRWVAVYKGEVVAVGDNAEEVVKLAKERKGPECHPVVQFVEGSPYVY